MFFAALSTCSKQCLTFEYHPCLQPHGVRVSCQQQPPQPPKQGSAQLLVSAASSSPPVLLAHALDILMQELHAARKRQRHLAQLLHAVCQPCKVPRLAASAAAWPSRHRLGLAAQDDAGAAVCLVITCSCCCVSASFLHTGQQAASRRRWSWVALEKQT